MKVYGNRATAVVVLSLLVAMATAMYLWMNRPPPGKRAYNPEWACWTDDTGDHCVHNDPPYTRS